MGHEIELRKNDLEHLSDIRTVNDWIIGILKADILSEEFIKPSVRIQCCTSSVKLSMNFRVSGVLGLPLGSGRSPLVTISERNPCQAP